MQYRIAVLVLGLLFLLSGCVYTALYGNKFEKTDVENQYTLKVAYGGAVVAPGLLPDETVDEKTRIVVEREATHFIYEHPKYDDFKILNYERGRLVTYMKYLVEFSKKDK